MEGIVGSTITVVYESGIEREGIVYHYDSSTGCALVKFCDGFQEVCIKDVPILTSSLDGDDGMEDTRCLHKPQPYVNEESRNTYSFDTSTMGMLHGTKISTVKKRAKPPRGSCTSKWERLGVAGAWNKQKRQKAEKAKRGTKKVLPDSLDLTSVAQQQSEAMQSIKKNHHTPKQCSTSGTSSSCTSDSCEDSNASPAARQKTTVKTQSSMSPTTVGRKSFTAAGGLHLERQLFHSELRAWACEGDKKSQTFTFYKNSNPQEYKTFMTRLQCNYPACFNNALVDILLQRKFAYERNKESRSRDAEAKLKVMVPRKKKCAVFRGSYREDDFAAFLRGGCRR